MGNRGQGSARIGGCGSIHPHSAWSLPSNGSIGGIPNSKGFTLIEIVIVIVIVAIVASIAAVIILQGARAYLDEDRRTNLHYQAQLAVERMAREIRLVRSQTDITTMTANTFQYTDIAGNLMRFQVVGNTIQLLQNATSQPLANGVTALNFTYFQQDGVTPTAVAAQVWYVAIDVTAQQGTESLQVRTRVHPMNFD